MSLNQFFVLKQPARNKVITDGKHQIISHIRSKMVHLLRGKGADRTIAPGTIVQLVEFDNDKRIGTFYIPSEDCCYIDILDATHYEHLKIYPFSNKIWDTINNET